MKSTIFFFILILLLTELSCKNLFKLHTKKISCTDQSSCFPSPPANLIDKAVMIQTYQNFNNKKPCLTFDGQKSFYFFTCDDFSTEKWIIKQKGSRKFTISPASNPNLFLSKADSSSDSPGILSNNINDPNIYWAIVQLSRGSETFYSFVNLKYDAGLYYTWKNNELVTGVYVSGWWEDHYLFKIQPIISNAFPIASVDKFINIRSNANRLCLFIEDATKKLKTNRCGSTEQNQHFKFIRVGANQYNIFVERYPNMFLARNNDNEVLLTNINDKNAIWSVIGDMNNNPYVFQLLNLGKTGTAVDVENAINGKCFMANQQNVGSQWFFIGENLTPFKSPSDCRNTCNQKKGTICNETKCCKERDSENWRGCTRKVQHIYCQPSCVITIDQCEFINF